MKKGTFGLIQPVSADKEYDDINMGNVGKAFEPPKHLERHVLV
jgi:hypothetical protein